MIAAVALFSFAYFSIIELIAFSYAISGWSFSMSAIQRERKPFQRLPTREKKPICVSLGALGCQLSALSEDARERRADSREPHGSCSFGKSFTTRATAS